VAITLNELNDGKVVEVQATGKLTAEDYYRFIPVMEGLMQKHGTIRASFQMTDFHGWEAGALWEDIKFDFKHFSHIDRLALISDKKWERGVAKFCWPFTRAKVRYFDHAAAPEARAWLLEP
jgi:stage II sporulation SpoAA-like protein